MLSSRKSFTPASQARRAAPSAGVACHAHVDRRHLLLTLVPASAVLLLSPAASQAKLDLDKLNKEVDAEASPYIQELLRKTAEKKDERKKERLDAYYKKNFGDYFEFEAGDARTARARGITPETQQRINDWLEANK